MILIYFSFLKIRKEYPLHPSINGRVIDLSELYTKVITKGGYKKVSLIKNYDSKLTLKSSHSLSNKFYIT